MGHDREVYFWIAISPLPGNPQFLPLDKIFVCLEKYAVFESVPLQVWRGRPRPRVGEHLHRTRSDSQLACPFEGLCSDAEE